MQQTSIAPEVKAALARCFAAHRSLRSYSAEVAVTVRGVPKQGNGRVRLALARPDRVRFELDGARAGSGCKLMVAASGYLYEVWESRTATTRVPYGENGLVVACEDSAMLPLPVFSQLMVSPDGLEACIAPFKAVTQEAGKLVFRATGQATLTLVFDNRDLLLREARVTQGALLEGRDTYEVEFREVYQNVRPNPALPASLWRLKPSEMSSKPVKEKSIL